MRSSKVIAAITVITLLLSACRSNQTRVVIIQPFADFPKELSQQVSAQIRQVCPHTLLKSSLPLPAASYYPLRSRYRADRLIAYLKDIVTSDDTVVIGLTGKDISTTQGDKPDWGVMGLAYRPGRACVVSTFRLSKARLASQFYKVSIHELGHTQGLPHCPDKTCYMRDAEGGNPTDDEYHFCRKCKNYLKGKGWQLN